MAHVSTYLKHLKFPPALLTSPISKYFQNLRLIFLIVIAIVVFGIASLLSLPRNLYPDVTIPDVIVTTIIPGAGPSDVESLVTIPVEDAVTGIAGVKTVTSSSMDSVSSVVIEFNTGVDIDKARQDISTAVDSITTLPDSAQKPTIQKIDLQKTPIWTFAITGNGDSASIHRFSNKLKQDLVDLPSIDTVNLSGNEDQEIQIVVRPEAVYQFGLNPQQLMGAIKTGLSSYPSGNVVTTNSTFTLTIDQAVTTVDDIRQTKINLNGQSVSIQDIADVVEISKPGQLPVYVGQTTGTEKAVTFDVFRVSTVNIETAQKDAQDLIGKDLRQEGGKFKLLNEVNYAKEISDQFSELQKDLIETILLVAVVLFLFLGARQSGVALLATPLTFLISFIVMGITGITLNFLSVFALLLSLGLLVDDTIVVVSAVSAYNRAGKFSPLETGLLVFRDFIGAITTTTATTIWAFLPILIAGGIIGLFIKPIPIVVSTTLAGSYFVAIFITLPLMIFLLKPNFPKRVRILAKVLAAVIFLALLVALFPKNSLKPLQIISFLTLIILIYLLRDFLNDFRHDKLPIKNSSSIRLALRKMVDHGILSFQGIELQYSNFIYHVLGSRRARRTLIVGVIIFSIFSYLLVPLGFVKNEFFPKTDADTLSVSVELPPGTNISTSQKEALALMPEMVKTPETNYVILNMGGAGGFAGFGGTSLSENTFNYTLVFRDHKKMTSSEIADYLRREFKDYNKGTFSVNEATGGPPAGSDIQFKIFGPDLTILDSYATKVEDYLKSQPGATNVDKSIKSGTSKIVFKPDNQKLTSAGLSGDTVGFWLRLYATGVKVDSIKLDSNSNTSEDITIRMQNDKGSVEDIGRINIPTPTGGVVPLSSLGKLALEPNPTLITREDGKRTISVSAGVKSGYTIPQVNKDLEKYANSTLNLPEGYTWQTGGVNEQNQQSVNDIFKAMIISILLIVVTMVLEFHSFRRALIVILVIPLAISGVFIVFALTGTALTFPAMVGVLALFGIVVKNSILIMDRIVANIKTGMEFRQSISDAASSRLEPIALTSICAIVGLIPITLSDPLWRGLGGAIIAGLAFSGTIMLFFIPVVYYITFRSSVKNQKTS